MPNLFFSMTRMVERLYVEHSLELYFCTHGDFLRIAGEDEIRDCLSESSSDLDQEVDFETFLREYVNLQVRATAKMSDSKTSSSFLKATTTTLRHTISESEKSSYVSIS
ncbi:hypothetical protein ACS0TY_024484 [Phlomoides rotata]